MEKHETNGHDRRLLLGRGVGIRTIDDLRSGAEILVKDFYFEGLNVLRCYEGRYRFERKGHPVVYLEPGEVFVIYPGHTVTIEALEKSNRLVYGIFTGSNVTDYFSMLGCFDGLHGRTVPRFESVKTLRALMKPELYQTEEGHDACMGYLADLIVSLVNDLRASGNPLLFDAVGQIRANLAKGIVRLRDLCDALNVSRSYLHRVFQEGGLGSAAAFIKGEQLNLALRMLRNTDRPIAAIAKAAGFISVTHFSTFVKKHIGRTPSDVRREGQSPCPSTETKIAPFNEG